MRRAVVLAVLVLGACGHAPEKPVEPLVTVQTVNVPVAVPCRPDVGPAPSYADTPEAIQAAVDIYELAKLLLAGREQREGRLKVQGAAIEGCANAPSQP